MFKSYILIAWRHILKNKLYSTINILGLVVGLSIYFFGFLLAEYEQSHDTVFRNSHRIFTVGSVFSPTADAGLISLDAANSALGPIIEAEIPELEAVARTIKEEFLVSVGVNDYYQTLRFADSDLLRIFDFTYIEGNASALDNPAGLLLTRSAAAKFFGGGIALGKSIILDHDKVLNVTAVIADLPLNTHFNSSLISPAQFELVAHISVLNTQDVNAEEGNWNNLSLGNLTYLLAPEGMTQEWLRTKLDDLYAGHFPVEESDIISGFKVNRLAQANTFLWSAIGMPMVDIVRLLAVLVLIVAIVNYTNLATAQSLGRTREIGLRKSMGATRSQLLVQFLVESVFITMISMVISVALLELIVPVFNTALGKVLNIDYARVLPWLTFTTVVVGLTAGAYPAYLITRISPIHSLQGSSPAGPEGSVFRSTLLGIQFAISIFMLAMVLVVYFQNAKIEESGDIYPRSQIVTLQRLQLPRIQSRLDVLRNEIAAIQGVTSIAYSSQVPFQQSNATFAVSAIKGDETNQFNPNNVEVSPGFFALYDIPLLSGRLLDEAISDDTLKEEIYTVNVIVNELMLDTLGHTLATENPVFHDFSTTRPSRTFSIVGVVPNQNFLGFHNKIKPMIFIMDPKFYNVASVKIQGRSVKATLADIEDTWSEVIKGYPIQVQFLDETFNEIFKIYAATTAVMTGFAFLAMTLSMVGLFGLAAFMVERRTREIGIRKVMGANLRQIVLLLIWQFSKPVMWASLFALPAAYFASESYLEFFADRLSFPAWLIVIAGITAILLSWAIVSVHATRIARRNPVHSLRHD